ncbi:MAG: hypothetical protein ACOX75_08050 [Lachnospiraceae bacterium]
MIKGFTLDDERLKGNAGGNSFLCHCAKQTPLCYSWSHGRLIGFLFSFPYAFP